MKFLESLADWQKIAMAVAFFAAVGGAAVIKAQEYVTQTELAADRNGARELRERVAEMASSSAVLAAQVNAVQKSNLEIREDLKTLLQAVLATPPRDRRRQ